MMLAKLKQLLQKALRHNRAIISDILLWTFLVFLLVCGIYQWAIALPAQRGQVITLSFKDINEISKGSAVRLMGTDIGFVDDIQIQSDHVDLKIQTYPGALKIPPGSTFSILFTGLAGDKSLEVELPDSGDKPQIGERLYLAEEPIRMKDALNSYIDITHALQKGAENITDFFGKRNPVEELQFNIRNTHQVSDLAVSHTRHLNQAFQQMNLAVHHQFLFAEQSLKTVNGEVNQLTAYTNPAMTIPQISSALHSLIRMTHFFTPQTVSPGNPLEYRQNMSSVHQQLAHTCTLNQNLNHQVTQARQFMARQPLHRGLIQLTSVNSQVQGFLRQVDAMLSHYPLLALQHGRATIQSVNRTLQQWLLTWGKLNGHRQPALPQKNNGPVNSYNHPQAVPSGEQGQ